MVMTRRAISRIMEEDFRFHDNAVINDDGTVSVQGNMDIREHVTNFRIKFRSVSGELDCGGGRLRSLINGPETVGASFFCEQNSLTTLEGAPKSVGIFFNCSDNNISSLRYAPTTIGRDFLITYRNNLGLLLVPEMRCNAITFESAERKRNLGIELVESIVTKYCGSGPKGTIALASQLIENGFTSNLGF